MTPAPVLAARLAARILHDISGAASGVAAGLDLLAGRGQTDLEAAGLDLAVSSATRLLDLLDFHKVAFGARGEPIGRAELRRLALTQFETRRPRLEWTSEIEPLPGPAAQAMLILLQAAADALAVGGVARAGVSVDGDEISVRVDGEGPRARLRPETLDGLAGRDLSGGLAGQWAPASYLHAIMIDAGGAVTATIGVDRFTLTATLRSGEAA